MFLISLFELRLLFASILNDFEVIQLKYVWWLLASLSFRKFYISKTHTYELILSIYPPFPLLLYFYPFAQFFIAIIHCSYCLSHDSIALLLRFVWKRKLLIHLKHAPTEYASFVSSRQKSQKSKLPKNSNISKSKIVFFLSKNQPEFWVLYTVGKILIDKKLIIAKWVQKYNVFLCVFGPKTWKICSFSQIALFFSISDHRYSI